MSAASALRQLALELGAIADELDPRPAAVPALTVGELEQADRELAESLAALSNRLDGLFHYVQPLRHTKAGSDTQECARCGGTFASEPGPPLCGRCWVTLGRPAVWPARPELVS